MTMEEHRTCYVSYGESLLTAILVLLFMEYLGRHHEDCPEDASHLRISGRMLLIFLVVLPALLITGLCFKSIII